jgi:hypothetical protein
MTVRALLLAGITGLSIGCTGAATDDKVDTAEATDDTGGGGSGELWRPSGSGVAYFLDGTAGNSLFHLELTRCTEPAEGEAYYGWVSRGGADPIPLGEIACSNEEVYFEHDIGENAIIGGYDTFGAWATDDGGATPGTGTALWAGQVDPVVYGVIQELLIASDVTPDGQGSLRAVSAAVASASQLAQDTMGAPYDANAYNAAGESIANTLDGAMEDRDGDGTASSIAGLLPVLGAGGYLEIIFDDLQSATARVEPGNPIKDYIEHAYDCTENIETHVYNASISADIAAVCLSESSCDTRFEDVVEDLGYALSGYDANEDGTVDLLTEGTIDCAITYASEMAQMAVEVP